MRARFKNSALSHKCCHRMIVLFNQCRQVLLPVARNLAPSAETQFHECHDRPKVEAKRLLADWRM